MKRIIHTLVLVGLVGVLKLAGADADEQGPPAGERKGQTTITMQSPETIRGEVLRIDQMEGPGGRGAAVVLELKTERGTIPVHLGPSWYLENQRVQIKPEDQVEVTGTRVTIQDKQTLIASQVKKGDQVLNLRDQNGQPAWAGTGGMGMTEKGMTAQQQKMMEQHQKLAARMKAREVELDKKVSEMNNSEGQAKINAMVAVINQLVQERKAMRENLAGINEGVGFGAQTSNEGEEEELGTGGPGDDTEDDDINGNNDDNDEELGTAGPDDDTEDEEINGDNDENDDYDFDADSK